MTKEIRTNAASSGVKLNARVVQGLSARTDLPGLRYLAQWVAILVATGALVVWSIGSLWMWPAMLIYGIVLCVPAYAMSHETAHGTAFKTGWINEAVLWISSFIYMEEPLHRRYTHTNHHMYTWHVGKDTQMPFDTPMGLGGWITEATGLGLARFHALVFWNLATRRYTEMMRRACPETAFNKMTRNARIMVALYAAIGIAPFFGFWWPLWLFVIPRILGAPIMLLFTLLQHVELQENSPSILESTRSFVAGKIGAFLYMNMNHHVEHHLYPQVPFHALPDLADAVEDQVPPPDPGFFQCHWDVLRVATRRTLGLSTKAKNLRQADHMISDGGQVQQFAQRSM